jgi:hypothetical protein
MAIWYILWSQRIPNCHKRYKNYPFKRYQIWGVGIKIFHQATLLQIAVAFCFQSSLLMYHLVYQGDGSFSFPEKLGFVSDLELYASRSPSGSLPVQF